MKKVIIVLAIVVIGIVVYYLVSNKSSNMYAPSIPDNTEINAPAPDTQSQIAPTPETPTTNTHETSSITVNIKNFLFNPSTLTIKTGTKVTWVNNDTAPHTVTSDTGNFLNSPTLSSGQSFSFTFTNTGATNYHCDIHPMMKGSVVVTN